MNDSAPRRLLDPDAPTLPGLRALLQARLPKEPSEEVEERLEERIYQTLIDQPAGSSAEDVTRRSAG